MFGNSMSIAVGIGIGIYIAQNYDVPDIKKLAARGVKLLTNLEKSSRKEDSN